MNTVEITEANFQAEVLKSDKPVLIDFWATWCGPCRVIAPIVEQLAVEYRDTLKVGKVDVDSNQMLAGQFGIRSIPTLLLFKGGRVVAQITGAIPKQVLVERLSKHLN